MSIFRSVAVLMTLLILSGCASKFRSYDGPQVTRVILYKQERVLQLYHHGSVLKSYRVGLGFAPKGHKVIEGDGRTPEGHYYIDRRNPNSTFHLSIGISYPNEVDRATAHAMGQSPGGDIFIHGRGDSVDRSKAKGDWTWGCIAVSDREIEEIYAMVQDGTPITIYAQSPVAGAPQRGVAASAAAPAPVGASIPAVVPAPTLAPAPVFCPKLCG